MNEELITKLIQKGGKSELKDAMVLVKALEKEDAIILDGQLCRSYDKSKAAHEFSMDIRNKSMEKFKKTFKTEFLEVYKDALTFDAPYDFDAFCMRLEWDRPKDKKFYMPRRKQLKPLAKYLEDLEYGRLDLLAISTPPGVGKALANDTPVLTRNGWKNHGDLRVGDEVIGEDGEFKKVLAVHPKCMLDRQITFTNGERIVCHENHEWKFYNRNRQKYETTPTFIMGAYKLENEMTGRGHRYSLMLPRHKTVLGEHKDIFDPYTLGVWLGDGTNTNPTISNPKCDKAIIDRVSLKYPIRWETEHKETGVMYYGFGFRKELQKYDMCHSRIRKPKHIPEEYLTADISQRLELLAGLMDTDGTLTGNKYIYTTTEPRLRDDVIALVSTFGWRTCLTVQPPTMSSSGILGKRELYIISFSPDMEIPCSLERKRLKGLAVQRRIAIQRIDRVEPEEGNCITVEGGMYLVGKTLLPTHNSTLALFYLAWIGGRHPELTTLCGSHSNSFLEGMYGELARILGIDSNEYCWREIFNVRIVGKNAKNLRIDLGSKKRFETYEFSSIGSGNAGKVRASNLLYCDDLVSDIEQAMSHDRMEKLWQQYYTDLRQRKIGKAKELHIATRWSIYDPLGRLENEYENDPRAKFIRIPALNDKDESNFDYPYNLGFTTSFYRTQRDIMDEASWKALYMNEPIEREGLLVDREKLRRFFTLPDGEPDAIVGVCDTKTTGPDYCALPLVYVYGRDYYVKSVLFENYAPDVVEKNLVNFLLKENPQMVQFESNVAGGKLAQTVQEQIKEKGSRTKITTKWTQANKETKIIVNMPWVIDHCLFLDDSMLKGSSMAEYRGFLNQLCSYSMNDNHKKKHDDAPDSMAQLAEFVNSMHSTKVSIAKRFF